MTYSLNALAEMAIHRSPPVGGVWAAERRIVEQQSSRATFSQDGIKLSRKRANPLPGEEIEKNP